MTGRTSLAPAEAVAAAICWLHRWSSRAPHGVRADGVAASRHGEACAWCTTSDGDLVALIRAFDPASADARAFSASSLGDQRRQVLEALQGHLLDER